MGESSPNREDSSAKEPMMAKGEWVFRHLVSGRRMEANQSLSLTFIRPSALLACARPVAFPPWLPLVDPLAALSNCTVPSCVDQWNIPQTFSLGCSTPLEQSLESNATSLVPKRLQRHTCAQNTSPSPCPTQQTHENCGFDGAFSSVFVP